jgi:RNA 3'-phosphate cyclase
MSTLEIDGSLGEGGGQVLRSALALSILCQQPIYIDHIRAGREKPGLQPQHIQAVQAAAAICSAQVKGAARNAQALSFAPGPVRAGDYAFDIGTAGSTSLVLQTILLPLSKAGRKSRLTITGGTHVPWSPPFEFIHFHWLPFLEAMGIQAKVALERCGFYPQGGGQIQAVIQPAQAVKPLRIPHRGALQSIRGVSAVGNLSIEIATRQKHQALRQLQPRCANAKIKTVQAQAFGKGTYLFLAAQSELGRGSSSALGAMGKRAERVADEAVQDLLDYLESEAAIDGFLADQLLLPCALAESPSLLSVSKVTNHLLTNAQIIQQFGLAKVAITGGKGEPGMVAIDPVGRISGTL